MKGMSNTKSINATLSINAFVFLNAVDFQLDKRPVLASLKIKALGTALSRGCVTLRDPCNPATILLSTVGSILNSLFYLT